ncbi:MAG: choice-of-anchor Q domain-containing protein [Isosphaerales bacterium]
MGYGRKGERRHERALGPGSVAGCARWVRKRDRHRLRPVFLALEDRRLLSSFTVTSTADDGSTGTLRWAVTQANSDTSPSTIEIQLGTAPATITLSQGQLELSNTSESITINDGTGQGPVAINGNRRQRVFQIDPTVTASLSGLTIEDGDPGIGYSGGGLYNDGTMTLTGCTIIGNYSGLYNKGTATLTNCTVSSNSSSAGGGGGLQNTGTATLTGCIISGNRASNGTTLGAGGLQNKGTATLTGCTISGNYASNGNGGLDNRNKATLTDCTISGNTGFDGGVSNSYNNATLMLTNCTISGNHAQYGAGLEIAGTATLTNCTISGNRATGYGGGLWNVGTATVIGCTISGNYGALGGGGLYNTGSSASSQTSLTDTIVAGNTNFRMADDISGKQAGNVTGSYNLIGDGGSGGILAGTQGNIMLTSPGGLGLAPLGNNGGPTQTMALFPFSPAIGAGTAVSGVTTDQRGQPLDSPQPDIGAFQTQNGPVVPPTSPLTVTSTADDGSIGTLRWAVGWADLTAGQSTIDIQLGSAPATITLSDGPLELSSSNTSESITIDESPGAGPVTINGNKASRVFQVDEFVTATISGLTITGGSTSGSGGGLYNVGTATLTDCTISGNSFGLTDEWDAAGVTLTDCTISGNSSGGLVLRGTATLTDCTISGNSGGSGGVYSNGTASFTACTISGNSGGGLQNRGTATLTDCTISGNSGGSGGVWNQNGTASFTACTISGNSASQGGGGLYNYTPVASGTTTASLTDTIVASNTGPGGNPADIGSHGSVSITGTYNLIGTGGSGGLTNGVNGNIVLTSLGSLGLAPLGDNGGPTLTQALLAGSRAIGAGIAVSGITTDQRGQPLDSPQPDIGAFQTQPGQGGPTSPFIVTSTADDGSTGTLRWAVQWADLARSPSLIVFKIGSAPAVITLSGRPLELSNTSGSVTIYDGPGEGPVTISGNKASRVFQVDQGVTASFSDLTITAGSTSGNGAGLDNAGTATLTDCTISGNSTAIEGGGLFDSDGAGLTVTDCTISGNSAQFGGGVWNYGAANLTACTISGNSASKGEGGLYNQSSSAASKTSLIDTIVAGNTGSGGAASDIATNNPGTVTGTSDLIGTGGSGGIQGGTQGNIVLTSLGGLGLGPLSGNGGLTHTMALLPGSLAIGAGTAVSGITTDQRGQPLDSPQPDIGAFQTQPGQVVPTSPFIVTSTADDGGIGTLRWAVQWADLAPSPSAIVFKIGSAPAVIVLSQGQLELSNSSESVAIYDGPGEGPVTVSGNKASRVFQVDQGVTASFSGLTITGGSISGSNGGSGLYNQGTATLTDCTISGNSTFDGGGAGLNNKGTATLTNCTISGNTTSASGPAGGLATYGTATLTDCTISGNSAKGVGGGLGNWGTATFTNCTISGNSSADSGGGIWNYAGPSLTLTACTISDNSAAMDAGGLAAAHGTATLTDTIVAANTGSGGAASDVPNDFAGIVTGKHNLFGTGGSGQIQGGIQGNIVLTSLGGLGLGPLFDNGGLTQTQALLPGSPAIGAGKAVSGITTDQRGQPLDSPQPDIGAFQFQPGQGVAPTSPFIVTSTADDGSTGTLRWAVTWADLAPSPSTIEFQLGTAPATITLLHGQLDLSNSSESTTVYVSPGDGPVIISGNDASRVFQVEQGVTATISGITIMGGTETTSGGGGLNNKGTATLTNCTISGSITSGPAGGLANYGTATLTDCTISGNSAQGDGGGLGNWGTATLTDCTISGNSSATFGGGLWNYAAPSLTLTACTISGNSATQDGGGLAPAHGTATLTDTIVAGNTGGGGAASDIPGSFSGTVTGTSNLIGPGGSAAIQGGTDGNIVLTSLAGLGLAPLGDFTGLTQTMALLPGSPAIGAGTAAGGVTADQRGEPLDSSPDIGAFQSQGFTLTAVAGSTPQSAPSGAAFNNPLAVTVTAKNTVEPVAGGIVSFTVTPAANGASTNLSGATALIGANGVAQVTATANTLTGSYTVAASAAGTATPVDFSLSNLIALTFSGLTNPSVTFGTSSATIAGTIASGSKAPTGEVVAVRLNGVTQPANIQSNGSFSTTFTNVPGLTVAGSPYTISYSYASDGTFASAGTTGSLIVIKAAPTVSVMDSGGTYNGTAFPAAATVAGVSGSAATSLEGVTPSSKFYSGIYTSAAQLAGLTPLSSAPSKAGSYTVLASFAGSSDYSAGSALANFTIAPATPTVVVTDSGGIFTNTAYPAAAMVAGISGSATASLEGVTPSLSYYGGTYTSAPQLAGLTPLTGAPGKAGSYTVLASFAGSSDYSNGSALANFTIAPATPTLRVTDGGGIFTNTAYPAAATVEGISGSATASLEGLTPSLSYYSGTYTGAAQLAGLTPLAGAPSQAGSYTVLASFPGSTDYTAIQSAPINFTITRATSTIGLNPAGGLAVHGQSVTLVATVTAAGTPSGSVTFFDGVTPLGTVPLDGSGKATLTTSSLALGPRSITATYSGDSDLLGVTSRSTTESVSQAGTQVVLVPLGVFKKKKLVSVGLTAEITPLAPGGGTPTGTVKFMLKKKTLGTATLGGGEATLTLKANSVLNKAITIVYSGDPNFRSSTATPKLTQKSLKSLARPMVALLKRVYSGHF